jgi:hypothetical protein
MVGRALVALAFVGAVACGSMPRPPVGAPADSYTPRRFVVELAGESSTIDGAAVTERFFTTERVLPLLGRFFTTAEYSPGAARVVVLSHAFWRTQLSGNPASIGQTVTVDGQPRTIVGIAPEAFRPENGGAIWIPAAR